MNNLKHLLIAEGFYFMLTSIALYSLLISSSDFNTKLYGVIGFFAMLWVTIVWIMIARRVK